MLISLVMGGPCIGCCLLAWLEAAGRPGRLWCLAPAWDSVAEAVLQALAGDDADGAGVGPEP